MEDMTAAVVVARQHGDIEFVLQAEVCELRQSKRALEARLTKSLELNVRGKEELLRVQEEVSGHVAYSVYDNLH